jgi:hypothetical protein
MLDVHPTLRVKDIATVSQRNTNLPLPSHSFHYTYNARGAIYRLLKANPAARKSIVLLPGFHCFAVVEPVLQAGYQPLFYRVQATCRSIMMIFATNCLTKLLLSL